MSRKRKVFGTILICIIAFAIMIIYFFGFEVPKRRERLMQAYETGIQQIERGEYKAGIETLYNLGNYREGKKYIKFAWDHLEEYDG